MRNRAKCKLCGDVIESFHREDFVTCKCESIALSGGNDYFGCYAKDWSNFIRIDDDNNEIIPKIVEMPSKEEENNIAKENIAEDVARAKPMTKEDMIKELKRLILSIEQLPPLAMATAITHYDFVSLLLLLVSIFEADLKDCS